MMHLLLLVFVIWVVVRLTRGAVLLGGHHARRHGARSGGTVPRGRRRRGRADSSDESASKLEARPRPALAPESPMERLQRQFVAGDLTIEEYEQQLDKVLRV